MFVVLTISLKTACTENLKPNPLVLKSSVIITNFTSNKRVAKYMVKVSNITLKELQSLYYFSDFDKKFHMNA